MIHVTRLDGSDVVVNADLVATVERTPDTVLALVTGVRIMVKETVEDIVNKVIDYRRRLQIGPTVLPDDPEIGSLPRESAVPVKRED
jgi:flagellar protein FlbD